MEYNKCENCPNLWQELSWDEESQRALCDDCLDTQREGVVPVAGVIITLVQTSDGSNEMRVEIPPTTSQATALRLLISASSAVQESWNLK